METFIKGDVIVLPFPFTDLSSAKRRPALILSGITGDDYIMLQITSKNVNDTYEYPLQKQISYPAHSIWTVTSVQTKYLR